MKLPNGYGSIVKLSGNRRNPWMVRKTIGYNNAGKEIRRTLGYYPTRAKAMQALAEYNEAPLDLDQARITFSELYDKWFSSSFDENTNRSTIKNYTAAYKHCEKLYKMRFCDIRTSDMQRCLDSCERGYTTASRMKIMFNQMYLYALQRDMVKRNLTEGLKIKQKNPPSKRDRFSTEEVKVLWNEYSENNFIPFILIMLYSGCRINELLHLEKKHVHFDEQYFDVVESKTASGIRKVPIANKVLPFWKQFCEKSACDKVFTTVDGKTPLSYDNFKRHYWDPLCARLGMKHTPHETRHTCISMLTTANINPTYIKIIVGHKSIMDLTERTYTHIEMSELLEAINKI